MSIFIRACYVLLAICFAALTYYVVIWVLNLIGIPLPPDPILKIVFVILGLLAVIGALTGKIESWFGQ
jgi:uncharacterized membrane protein